MESNPPNPNLMVRNILSEAALAAPLDCSNYEQRWACRGRKSIEESWLLLPLVLDRVTNV
jgi:hypothetical protein